MFRLTKVLNVPEDVFNKILYPHDEVRKPGEEAASRKIALVGKEKDGVLILARSLIERDAAKTCIDLYDYKSHKSRTIYNCMGNVGVICATVNDERSLLAFVTEGVNEQSGDLTYVSWIAELHGAGTHQSLESTSKPQKLHFIQSLQDSSNVYVLSCSQDECSVFQLPVKPVPGGLSVSRKTKKNPLSKKTTWFEYDTQKPSLFMLTPKQAKGIPEEYIFKCFTFPPTSKFAPAFELPLAMKLPVGEKLNLLYPFPYSGPSSVSKLVNSPLEDKVLAHVHAVRMAGYGLCLCQQHEIDSAGNSEAIKISIFVIHLRQKIDFSIPLMNMEGGRSSLVKTRVIFDSIGAMLLVYIPGYFLQLIDCGEEHYPCVSICLTDRESSSPLPYERSSLSPEIRVNTTSHQRSGSFTNAQSLPSTHSHPHPHAHAHAHAHAHTVPIPMPGAGAQAQTQQAQTQQTQTHRQTSTVVPFPLGLTRPGDDDRHFLLDTQAGIVYEYSFDREAMLVFLKEPSHSRWHVQTLHLACVHMQDSELVDQIVIHTCTNNPQSVTVELMKEFLLGTPYQAMKNLGMDINILQVLPITEIDLLETGQLKKLGLPNSNVSALPVYPYIPGTKVLITNKDDEWKKRKYPTSQFSPTLRDSNLGSPSIGSPPMSPPAKQSAIGIPGKSDSPQGISQVLRSVFGSFMTQEETALVPVYQANDINTNNNTILEDEIQECCALPFTQFIETLTDYWVSQLPKEPRAKLHQWAINFRNAQVAQVNRLYSLIQNSVSAPTISEQQGMLFQLYERLYQAVEELALPFPRGFNTSFASLGLTCLPRGVFLQCVDRGIITLTPTFLRDLLLRDNDLDEGKKERDFKLQLVLRLRDYPKSRELLEFLHTKVSHSASQYQVSTPRLGEGEEKEGTRDCDVMTLLIEHAISSLPHCNVAEDKENAQQQMFFDMEQYSNSTFIPMSVMLDHLKTPPAGEAPSFTGTYNSTLTFITTNAPNLVDSYFENTDPDS